MLLCCSVRLSLSPLGYDLLHGPLHGLVGRVGLPQHMQDVVQLLLVHGQLYTFISVSVTLSSYSNESLS